MSRQQNFTESNDGVCQTLSAQAALDILLSDDFGPLKLPEYYDRLALEIGRDFPNIRFALGFNPLMYNGAKHRELRRQGAVYLRSRAKALHIFERDAARLVGEKLSRPGRVELVSEIINPIFDLTSKAISGLPYYPNIIRVFTSYNSLKMLHKLEANFANLRKEARAKFPDDSAETHGIRIAFSTLGVTPTGASLAQSFAKVLSGADGVPVKALAWGSHYAATGLATVGRECIKEPVDLGESARAVRVCDVGMRAFLEEGGQPNYIFGVGAHACLGRKHALSLWAHIGEVLAQNTMRVRLLETAPSTHKIMDYPSKITIEVFP